MGKKIFISLVILAIIVQAILGVMIYKFIAILGNI